MNRLFWVLVFTGVLFLLDLYVFQAVKMVSQGLSSGGRRIWFSAYWGISGLTILSILIVLFIGFDNFSGQVRHFYITFIIGMFLAKSMVAIFLLLDDLQRLVRWITHFISRSKEDNIAVHLERAKFLSKAGLIAGTLPLITFGYGILKGAHNYQVRRQRIGLKNLPPAFEGLKIAQVSDIHSGSFFDRNAVIRGVKMLINQQPDLVFFTGDLVNNEASEMNDYVDVFGMIKAPMGVYSILGNHDYGDYITWPSRDAKLKNLERLIGIHKEMGWDILINENRILEKQGDKIAILGVENWSGRGNFPKYGKLNKAYEGTEKAQVKLLLSHDPTHWRGEVLKEYRDIDVTFSGHTHGFQFGIEKAGIKWSPIQWVYNEWAGLYQENDQFLYVNRGFGYIGFPGRVGIYPEITIFELYKT